MTLQEVLRELKTLGTVQNRKVYARHGVTNGMFGVSYANIEKLKKKIKRDHALAAALWATGNHDAQVLALKIADPAQVTPRQLESWAKGLSNYCVADIFSRFVSQTSQAREKMEQWMGSSREFIGQAGWNLLAHLAMGSEELPDNFLENYLKVIETQIHSRPNRVRHAMNNALIAIGMRNPRLQEKATRAARKIGKVTVDHGETGCETPNAEAYILKAAQRKKRPRT
jgi:3-methyladenine DNA glycosylase AlkD